MPYCALVHGVVEIVSGHHRIRAAREAGLKEIPVLVDTSGLSRSEIIAKQLAHNRLAGFDDPDTLIRLFNMLSEPDLILSTGLAADIMNLPPVDLEVGITPQMTMDWKTVVLTFLPHQFKDFKAVLEAIGPADILSIAPVEQFQPFMDAVLAYSRFKDVRNVGTALSLLSRIALEQLEESETQGAGNDEG